MIVFFYNLALSISKKEYIFDNCYRACFTISGVANIKTIYHISLPF